MPIAPDSLGPTICIGEILVEIVATTPGVGFLEPQPLLGPFPSGAPAIFIDQCGRMGGAAAIIGAVGNDDFGLLNLNRLNRDGVDTSAVFIDPALPTGSAFVRYRPDGERDFQFNMWTSAAASLTWTESVEAIVSRAGHLHVMGTLVGHEKIWPLIERAADRIKSRGGSVSLDPNMRKELPKDGRSASRISRLVAMADLLLPSGAELYTIAGTAKDLGETAALDSLFACGVSEVVIKRGIKGSSCHLPDGTAFHAPAFALDEVDPTGAGDCFGGAYLTSRRFGNAPQRALVYGNAAGARNVTQRGPMEGVGTLDDLNRIIADTERMT